MLSCGPRCRPVSRGASAIVGRSGDARADSRGTTAATVVGAILAVVLAGSFLVALRRPPAGRRRLQPVRGGLPEPAAALKAIEFEQQTIVYDRTGKIELARLGDLKRELVAFDDIPGEMLDATTAIEDKDFWTNPGFDPFAHRLGRHRHGQRPPAWARRRSPSSSSASGSCRASAFEGSTYDRKIREIIQSIRLTEAFPGQEGKEQIITAYLNQNFYGNQSYGVKAAARSYFGKSLDDLTLAQAAILAAIPQSPTRFDLVRNAESVCLEDVAGGRRVHQVQARRPARHGGRPAPQLHPRPDEDAQPADRRQAHGRRVRGGQERTGRARQQQVSVNWKAPHFVWQVRRQLGEIFCPETPDDCPKVDSGGLRVTTTLDWNMQKVAEKWVYVAARAPNAKDPEADPRRPARSRSRTRAGSSACAATTSTTRRRR